jgi:hypothetical protein
MRYDETYVRILLELSKEDVLGSVDIAGIIDPMFNLDKTRYDNALSKAEEYIKLMERDGVARKTPHRRKYYSVCITGEGKKLAEELAKSLFLDITM